MLQNQIESLQRQIRQAKSSVRQMDPGQLINELYRLETELQSVEKQIGKVDEQQRQLISNLEPFPNVRNKIAVFMFNDPDNTGLSNDLSLIISKHMLFSAPVGSYAIVTYQSDLRARDTTGLTYFDKVDRLTKDFGYTIAIWGEVKARPSGGVVVEAYVQVPNKAASRRFERRIEKETTDGRSLSLVASLAPQRLQIASLEFSKEAIAELQAAASGIRVLRDKPSKKGKVTRDLPEGQPFFLSRSSGDWVEITLKSGQKGWTSVRALCLGECRKLLSIADFSNALVGFADGKPANGLADSVSPALRPVVDQMRALGLLNGKPAASADIMARWIRERSAEEVAPPGGSAYANLFAVAELAASQGPINREMALDTARQLAKASVADPTNVDILRNLSTLFDFIGDRKRQEIPEQLVARYE